MEYYKNEFNKLSDDNKEDLINKALKVNFMGKRMKKELGVLLYLYLNRVCKTSETLSDHQWKQSFKLDVCDKTKKIAEYSSLVGKMCNRKNKGHKIIREAVNTLIQMYPEFKEEKDFLINKIINIFDKYFDKYFSNLPLQTSVCALMYILLKAKDYKVSQHKVGRVLNISSASLRTRMRKILSFVDKDLLTADS